MSMMPQGNPGPRLIPKVFADVPTAGELAAVQSSKNTVTMFAGLLGVLLVVAIAGLVWFGNQYRLLITDVTAKEDQIKELQTKVGAGSS